MKKKRPEYFTIIRKYLSHLNRQNISFASSEWVEKTSSKSCWAWLKVGHSTVGVIDVTGATSTIRGELVDVRQCHCAQWNIHRSALRPSFWLPGWLALIFLRLYTPLTIKRTYWAAHATEGHVAMEVWRWYWIRTGYLQAKQPPLPTKKTPPGHFLSCTAPKKALSTHSWALSHSSESFMWVGEHIWQPLSVSQCFFTAQSVKQ